MRVPPLLLAVLAVVGVIVPAGGAVALDPRIERSRAELQRARDVAAAATAALDAAAASYEEARAHPERPTIEQGRPARTSRRPSRPSTRRTRRCAPAWSRCTCPHLRLEAIDRAVLSDDVGDALHQLELVDQLARTGAQKAERADRVAGRVRAAEHDHRVVTAGIRDAVRERQRRATALGAALARARRQVKAADREDGTVRNSDNAWAACRSTSRAPVATPTTTPTCRRAPS